MLLHHRRIRGAPSSSSSPAGCWTPTASSFSYRRRLLFPSPSSPTGKVAGCSLIRLGRRQEGSSPSSIPVAVEVLHPRRRRSPLASVIAIVLPPLSSRRHVREKELNEFGGFSLSLLNMNLITSAHVREKELNGIMILHVFIFIFVMKSSLFMKWKPTYFSQLWLNEMESGLLQLAMA